MTAIERPKRRARRIAADEAHAWARNLKLKNPAAKLLLSMLTQYVDGDGYCFVSVQTLAEDCELVTNTIRSRLTWLEGIGAIARTAQWIDEYGHRNSKGHGRRTSDNIRLMIDLDQDQLEARAAQPAAADPAPGAGSNSEADPAPREGSNMPADPAADPALTLQRPFTSVQGLISEPEPEPESPPTPPGRLSTSEIDQEVEHFQEFWNAYPGHQAMQRHRALEVFATMTPAERLHARAASPLHATVLKKIDRRPRDAHKWLAEKGWQEYPEAKLQPPSSTPARRLIKAAELEAVNAILKIAGLRPLSVITTRSAEDGKASEGGFWSRPIEADLLAMAKFARADNSAWQVVSEGSQQFAAWRDRLTSWIGRDIELERIWQEPFDAAVHGLPGSHPDFKIRKFVRGIRVPSPWPPHRDGSWSIQNSEVAQ